MISVRELPRERCIIVDYGREPQSQWEAELVLTHAKPTPTSRSPGTHRAIILSLWDAYLTGQRLMVPYAVSNGPTWEDVEPAVDAIFRAGLAISKSLEDGPGFVLRIADPLAKLFEEQKPVVLNHSEPLDVHKWSEHPEVNSVVDAIHDENFRSRHPEITKKHVKVLLLDMFVRWEKDPSLKTAMYRDVDAYKADSRYNSLHISKKLIEVADQLEAAGLIFRAPGFRNPENGTGRTTRIWPSRLLLSLFQMARFGLADIELHHQEETIILRDKDEAECEYEDTDETRRMRDGLRAYNELLGRTFMDIPALERDFIELTDSNGHNRGLLRVDQTDKFVRRIFNRSSFEKGGRFYGGWWQRCPERWRRQIYLDDQPAIEIDYSGLHIVMLYAEQGIDYWSDVGIDPYEGIRPVGFEDFSGWELRKLCKRLLLLAVNAQNERKTFQAFRSESETGSSEKHLRDVQLSSLLAELRARHRSIAHCLATDAGIDLMYRDSLITEKLIDWFTGKGVPILTIHDSYIVPLSHAEELHERMRIAFAEVTHQPTVNVKWEQTDPLTEAIRRTRELGYVVTTPNPAPKYPANVVFAAPVRTKRYLAALRHFEGQLGRPVSRHGNSPILMSFTSSKIAESGRMSG